MDNLDSRPNPPLTLDDRTGGAFRPGPDKVLVCGPNGPLYIPAEATPRIVDGVCQGWTTWKPVAR